MSGKTVRYTEDGIVKRFLNHVISKIPDGPGCKDCINRRADKCNLLHEYLKVGEQGYKKDPICYDLTSHFNSNKAQYRLYQDRGK